MGRESRQARRQRERRMQQRQQKHQHSSTPRWAIFGGIGVIAAVAIVLAVLALRPASSNNAGSNNSTTAYAGPPIAGIQCNSMEQSTYHVHGHLQFYVNGKYSEIPAYIGEDINHDCLYWLHTHEPSYGVIHVEAPKKITPTLGQFFTIWHQPLSRQQAWKYSVGSGQSMKVYVNGKVYEGNPQDIKIVQHTDITIEIGPPFVQPKRFNFAAHSL